MDRFDSYSLETTGITCGGYSISGRVVDGSGNPISNAAISIPDGSVYTVTTDLAGSYTMSQMPAGSYWLSAAKIGYTFTPNYLEVEVSADVSGKNFTGQTCYILARSHTGSGSNPVASPSNTAGCPAGRYISGESITLTASPSAGYRVGSWSGTSNDASTSITNSLVMPASAKTVTVNYAAIPLPPTATLVSPSGTIDTNLPTYTWDAVSSSTRYYLWVESPPGSVVLDQWYTAEEAGCAGGTGTCSITPSIPLSVGSHDWWIQTWNDGGSGDWSSSLRFIYGFPPDPATLVSPGGTTSDSTPTYTWNAVSDSTWYYLWVEGPSGNMVLDQWYTAEEAGCAGGTGTCAITPSITLSVGNHEWWIQTWNDAGDGEWSSSLSFLYGSPPDTATLVSPGSTTFDSTPAYTWNAVSDSTWYYLWVEGPPGKW